MNDYINLAFGMLFFPFAKLIILVMFIISCFSLIRLRAELDAITFVLMITILSGAMISIVPVSYVTSRTYQISKDFKRNILPISLQHTGNRSKNQLRSQLKSCPLIRCKIGNFYHMEAQAKLTMLDRTVNGVVFLLVKVKC